VQPKPPHQSGTLSAYKTIKLTKRKEMKTITRQQLPEKFELKLDEQLDQLKKLVLNNYKDTTADKMELDLFFKVHEIGKTAMESYMLKKTMNSSRYTILQ